MATANSPHGYRSGTPRQRAVSSVLSALIVACALLLALWSTGVVRPPDTGTALTTFSIDAPGEDAGAKAAPKADAPEPKPQAETQKAAEADAVPQPVPTPTRTPPALSDQPSYIRMSRADFASADIGKMRKAEGGAQVSGKGAAMQGPGQGPGGVALHRADWYRRPTSAELSTYMTAASARVGWGTIACRTVDDYRVEDCEILDESPRGSGLGRAVLNASWQFRVIPPKINGEPQVGTWVSIRIEYTERGANARG
jgi:hypothetical protein